MSQNIDLADRYIEMIKPILAPISDHLYAFGSRVTGKSSQFSDLDLCYKGDYDRQLIRSIKEQLRNSDLPIKVDLVNYQECSEEFQSLIDGELVKFL